MSEYSLTKKEIQLPIRVAENLYTRIYNSKGLDEISLPVKYYVPLAHINKGIKLVKFKSAMNLQCFYWETESRERILLQNLIRLRFSRALSIDM